MVKGKGLCNSVELTIGELVVRDSCLLLELGGVEVIFGMQRLHTLGVMEVDWRNLPMIFYQGNQTFVLKGDPT